MNIEPATVGFDSTCVALLLMVPGNSAWTKLTVVLAAPPRQLHPTGHQFSNGGGLAE